MERPRVKAKRGRRKRERKLVCSGYIVSRPTTLSLMPGTTWGGGGGGKGHWMALAVNV
jgi:hypothetical protein